MAEIKEKLNHAIEDLTDIINTTHCGYCKQIVGDAQEILKGYEALMDKAVKIDEISRTRKDFLSETNKRADELIGEPVTQEGPHASGSGRLLGGMLGGGGIGQKLTQRISQRPVVNMMFGDLTDLFGTGYTK